MPKGIPNVKVAGQPMTTEDIQAAEARIEGKRAPLHEDDHPLPKAKIIETADGRKIQQYGNFQQPTMIGHESTLKRFARIEPDYEGWVTVTNDQAILYQKLKVMVGHDGDKKLGLIDDRKLNRIKKLFQAGDLSEQEMEAFEQLEATK